MLEGPGTSGAGLASMSCGKVVDGERIRWKAESNGCGNAWSSRLIENRVVCKDMFCEKDVYIYIHTHTYVW